MEFRSDDHYEFGDFLLDRGERLLTRQGRPLDVTPKALEILLLLVENAGRTVTKEEIFGRVWPDSYVEETNLSHHIFRLRKILGETEAAKFIETVPKRGYKFVSLEESLKDEAYRLPDNFTRRAGISWLHRWTLDKGREFLVPDEPVVPEFVLKASGFTSE